MKRSILALAGFAALGAAGSALADTTLFPGTSTTGSSIFVEVIDSTNNTSFTFDVGSRVGNWTDGSLSISLASDPNWTTFIGGVGAQDNVIYQVQGIVSVAPSTYTLDMTSNSLGNLSNSQLKSVGAANTFITAVNGTASATTNSIYAAQSTNPAAYGGSLSLGTATTNTNPHDLLGTALNFYQWTLNGTLNTNQANVNQFSGQWDLTSAGLLTYSGAAAVPLPPSVVFLLSGGVLIALIARRRTSGAPVSMGAMA
ncbi:MAG TPA: hypothetical protein VLV29_09165 [Steroidobacteraceae bacterium]|nr:hypothetical protein [Steroidobacteraceae bacterium]